MEADGLQRFVDAQDDVYDTALAELRSGRKRSHWMWFIFPQLRGLGHSPTSQHYGIAELDEAKAYAAHDILGRRLLECCNALLPHASRSALDILGSPDDMKLRSSMTLFAEAVSDRPLFQEVLDAFFAGERDGRTLALLKND